MYTYRMVKPLLRASTKPFAIVDQNGQMVGEVQRYYTKRIYWFLDLICNIPFINVQVRDHEGIIRARMEEVISWKSLIKEKWKVEISDGRKEESFTAYMKTKIKTNPRFLVENEDKQIWIKKDIGDKSTYFLQNDRVIAKVEPEGILLPHNHARVTIHLYNDDLAVHEVCCMYYVMDLKHKSSKETAERFY